MKKFITFLIGVPLLIVLVTISMANRDPIKLSFDPFSPSAPLIQPVELPAFIIFFCLILASILLGGIMMWFSQHKFRKQARQLQKQLNQTELELQKHKGPDLISAHMDES